MERGRKKRNGGRQCVLSSPVFNLVSAKDSPRNREQGCQLGNMTPGDSLLLTQTHVHGRLKNIGFSRKIDCFFAPCESCLLSVPDDVWRFVL